MTNKDIIEIIKMEGTATRALMRSEIDRIEVMDKVRNGRITEAECEVEVLKKETRITRWMHRNPKVAIIVVVVSAFILMSAFHAVNIRRTIEKVTKIELKD